MPQISELLHQSKKAIMASLQMDRLPWWRYWADLADYYMPKRYTWLMSSTAIKQYLAVNGKIIDPTGTNAAKILASGMMNGITSPSRPWFRLRLSGFSDDVDYAARQWLDEVERRMLLVMAESNFYNCLAIMYIDLVIFGTASMLIYEDYENVICCYNNALGEYYLGQDYRLKVNQFAREFTRKVYQVVEEWGLENCSDNVKLKYNQGGARLQDNVDITHLIEPNDKREGALPERFGFRELYWETSSVDSGRLLALNGYFEMPGVFPRWELTGNDSYGTSPGMDALGDVKQLQHESIRKAQSLDYMVRPPTVSDIQLAHKPSALMPGGNTFVAGVANGNVGIKPVYQFNPPIGELTQDLRDIQARIRATFNNDLFRMISELETVRSATEIDARREEKLVQLGPVLERFQNEALDPGINRVYSIMERAKLLPDPPDSIRAAKLEIQYVSILSAAQSAVGVIPTERFLQLVGNLVAVYPGAKNIPNFDELIRNYGRDIGVKAKGINSPEQTAALEQQDAKAAAIQQGVQTALPGAQAAKLLSETQVGGGASALDQIIGGAG